MRARVVVEEKRETFQMDPEAEDEDRQDSFPVVSATNVDMESHGNNGDSQSESSIWSGSE